MYIYEIYHVVLHADFMYFYVLCLKWRIKHVQSLKQRVNMSSNGGFNNLWYLFSPCLFWCLSVIWKIFCQIFFIWLRGTKISAVKISEVCSGTRGCLNQVLYGPGLLFTVCTKNYAHVGCVFCRSRICLYASEILYWSASLIHRSSKLLTNTRRERDFPVLSDNLSFHFSKTYVVRDLFPAGPRTYFRHICSLDVNFMQLWFFIWNRFLI